MCHLARPHFPFSFLRRARGESERDLSDNAMIEGN